MMSFDVVLFAKIKLFLALRNFRKGKINWL